MLINKTINSILIDHGSSFLFVELKLQGLEMIVGLIYFDPHNKHLEELDIFLRDRTELFGLKPVLLGEILTVE